MNRRTMIRAAVFAVLLVTSMPVQRGLAAPEPSAARAFIERLGQQALDLLRTDLGGAQPSIDRFRQLLRGNFDLRYMGQFILGRFWNSATPAQREEYLRLFEEMIVGIYANRFTEYANQDLRVTGARVAGDRDTLVQSEVIAPGGQVAKVDWRVREIGGRLQIIDVVVEELSLSRSQRQEFESVILRNGGRVEALLQELRRRS